MKFLITLVAFTLSVSAINAQTKETPATTPDKNKELITVEASCGQCKLGLKGDDCNLAIRIKDKAYFVDGTNIDDHGDAHAKDGFCNAVRKAQVQGEIVGERFKASYFKLLPETPEKKNK